MRKLVAASLFIVLLLLVPVLAGAAISRLYASLTVPTGGTIVDSNQTASACLGASSVGQYVYNTNCISTLTAGQNISIGSGATPTIGFIGTLPIANGGTNISSVTSGDCVRAASSTALGMAAGDCVTNVTGSGNIASSGGTTPNITLTGIVPIANGGTNISSVTSGDCVRAASSTAFGMAAGDCVTSVTASGNIASSGGTTPNITLTGIVPIANGGTNISSVTSGDCVRAASSTEFGMAAGDCVTSVTASGNIASSGGTTPNITLTGIVPIANGGTNISSVTSGDCVRAASSTAFGMAAGDCVTSVTGSGNIASSGGTTPNITLTGIVPIANGGTNCSAQCWVDLTTAQTVAGSKDFTSPLEVVPDGSGNMLFAKGTGANGYLQIGTNAGASVAGITCNLFYIYNNNSSSQLECTDNIGDLGVQRNLQAGSGTISIGYSVAANTVAGGQNNNQAIIIPNAVGTNYVTYIGTNNANTLNGISCTALSLGIWNGTSNSEALCIDGSSNESIGGSLTIPTNLILNQTRGSVFEEWPCVSTSTCGFYSGGTVAGTSGEVLDVYDLSTSASLFTLDHNGNEGVAGNFFAGSSEKVKRNIQSLDFDPLSVIDSTDWIQFCYKIDRSCHSGEEGSQTVGFIAEKTSAVLAGPHHNRVNPVTLGSVDGAAIKELSAEVSRLQAIVAALCANARDQAAVACAAQ